MKGAAADALVAALGADRVSQGEGDAFTVAPRDGEELAVALGCLAEHETPVAVRGHGTRPDFGNPLRDVGGALSTVALSGVLEFDEQDGVLHVGAGAQLAEVAETVARAGWELPLDPPGAGTSVGGAIATSATGPRRLRYGEPRRAILGLSVALASGERTRCGGRVVKNVTGYDMAKLYAGSLGTLGVIESAWLRLRPAPGETRTAVAMLSELPPDRIFALGLAVSRRPSVRAAALVSGEPARELGAPGADSTALVVECAGDAGAVAADSEWIAAEAGARAVPEEARLVGRLREQQASGALRARLAVVPSVLEATVAPLRDAGMGVIVYPGVGFVYASSEDGTTLEAVDAAAGAADADLLLEALPEPLRRDRDVFGDPGPRAPLLRALKQRFDPSGILNPGRAQGHL